MNDFVKDTTDESFDADVSNKEFPVLVDFWAEWCQPCKMVSNVIDEVAEEYDGRVIFLKLNVDHSTDIAAKYNIRGIPHLIMFVKGEVKSQRTGALNKAELVAFIDQNIQD